MNQKRYSFCLIFLCLTFFLSSPSFAALMVDDFEGNGLGGQWTAYADASSSISPKPFHSSNEGYQSDSCAHLEYELKSGVQYPFAGAVYTFASQNLTTYEGIRFRARGQGSWSCMLPIPATAVEYNHFSSPFLLTADWKLYEIPFSKLTQICGTKKTWDPSAVTGVQFSAGGNVGDKGWISVDNIEFYKKGEEKSSTEINNPILKEPKVNQEGYLPDDEKYFVISATSDVKKGDSYQIVGEGGGFNLSSVIESDAIDDTKSTGEKVFHVDFTVVNLPGRYTVSVNGSKSVHFSIKSNLF